MSNDPIFRVLLVDHDPGHRCRALRSLAHEHFHCEVAVNAVEARQLLQDDRFDVVITDAVPSPTDDAPGFVDDLLQQPESPVVIALIDGMSQVEEQRLRSHGVPHIERKPIDCDVFGAKVRAILGQDAPRSPAPTNTRKRSEPPPLEASHTPSASPDAAHCATVAQIMCNDALTAHIDWTIVDVSKLMSQHRVRHLPVVDSRNRLVGIVSQRDVFRQMSCSVDLPSGTHHATVRDFMTTDVAVAQPEMPLGAASEMILQQRIGCLPVVNATGELVGILTRTDILRFAAQQLFVPS